MRKIKEVIVVEGRYDKNTLSQIVDATIVETGEALPYETCHAYGSDSTTVHPNVLGHKKMFEGIVKAMYADKAKFAPAA